MKLVPPNPTQAPERGLFNTGESKRLRWMAFAFLLVVAAFFILMQKENARRAEEAEYANRQRALEGPGTVVVLPEIDGAELGALVRDATPAERVQLETPALARALRDTTLIGDTLFEPMGGEVIDSARCELLTGSDDSARDAARGSLLRAYGWVDSIEERDAAGELPAHLRGRLRLEDGGLVAFVVQQGPGRIVLEDDYLRVDGIFLKALRAERDGGWIEAPLLVGPRAHVSFPSMISPTELDARLFAQVGDDSLTEGITGQPFEAYWELVAYVRDLDGSSIEWEQAPLLDGEGMSSLSLNGAEFRAQPVRLPISKVMDAYVLAQPENPLRIERMTEGWIGNEKWIGPGNGLVKFVTPNLYDNVARHDLVVARGFFLKFLAYETSKAGIGVAPFFVLHEIERVEEGSSSGWQRILMTFGGGIVFLAGLLVFMLRRDRVKSAQLQRELLERRKARREAVRMPSA